MHDHPGAAEAATHETRAKFRSDGRQNEMTISPGTSEIRRLHGVSRSQNGNCGTARRLRVAFAAGNEHPPHRASVALRLLAHRWRCGSLRMGAERPAQGSSHCDLTRRPQRIEPSGTSNPGSPVRATLQSAHTNVTYFPRRIVSSLRASDRALSGRCTAP